MKYLLLFLISSLAIIASPRVVNWMEFPSHPSSPHKQFYLELEFHNPSIWVSDWGTINEDGRIDITTTSDPNAIVIQALYNAGYAYTSAMDANFGIGNLSIFIDGIELVDFENSRKVEFEYSKNLNEWKTVTVPVDSGNYFLRIKNSD
ncbi:MAG: hypothetical protein ACJZ9B_05640 [Coraliomargaritaceae bacterium]